MKNAVMTDHLIDDWPFQPGTDYPELSLMTLPEDRTVRRDPAAAPVTQTPVCGVHVKAIMGERVKG